MRAEIETYLQQGKAEGWSDETVDSYQKRLTSLANFLGAVRRVEVKAQDLERFIQHLRRSGCKRSSRRAFASTTRNFFGWLAEHGKIISNPAADLSAGREDEEELPPPPLSVEEVADILDNYPRRSAIDIRNRALLELLYGCGLRLSEALSLDVEDVRLADRTLHVRHGKGAKERELPLGRGVVHAVRDYLALRRSLIRGPDSGALLLDCRGNRLSDEAARRAFNDLNAKRRRKIHPHLFRHSIAVHLLQNGADIRYVQQFLGHEKLDTTKIYLRLVPGRLKEDYDKAFPDIAVNA